MTELLQELYKYTPRLVLEYIAEHPDRPLEPVAASFIGSALFADMAGFTTLTEAIMQRSANKNIHSGLIELADIVNLYLSRQIDIIDQFGGDIVKFAGDALIAVWPASSESELKKVTLQSVHCGLELQRQLHRTKIGSGLELSLRIGVGAGPLIAQMVGGLYDRWEFLIGGDTIDQIGRAEKRAEPGQVVISPQARRLISDSKTKREFGKFLLAKGQKPNMIGPKKIPELKPHCNKALQSFIPRRIVNLIEEGRGSSFARTVEVRTVTVLFIRILEWHTAELPIEQVHHVMRKVQDCLYRYEGAINRFGIEEKGTVILAAFGLPPLDHVDDALRAMHSARDIIAELKELGHKAVIGVGTGVVFVGPMGNEIRSEYTMHGNIVNLAARLMQASDSVYCDETTYQRIIKIKQNSAEAFSQLEFTTLEPMKVKGSTEPVQAYRLILN